MGAKTKTEQVSTLTPAQQALMNQRIQAVMAQLGQAQTQNLGGTWGGPAGPMMGGAMGGPMPTAPGPIPMGQGLGPQSLSAPTTQNLQGILGQNANGVRDQFTTPFVSPFRRHITGA